MVSAENPPIQGNIKQSRLSEAAAQVGPRYQVGLRYSVIAPFEENTRQKHFTCQSF